MDRKGAIALDELVALIPRVIVIVLLVSVLSTLLYNLVIRKDKTPEQLDLERIADEIKDISDGEVIRVPLNVAKPYEIRLFPENYAELPQKCNNRACLCLYTESPDSPSECETLRRFDVKDCDGRGLCVIYSEIKVEEETRVAIIEADRNNVLLST